VEPSPARYTIEFARTARRELADIPKDAQRRIAQKIDALAIDPRPQGVEKLSGHDALYRVRVGDFRIIYEIQDRRVIVTILRIGNRRDVYRGL
jgi:mRNA interferase RelE/StbE